jgi:LuxR family maltose regulon positive regulatory protein
LARATPLVDGTTLISIDESGDIVVGTAAWYEWLESATTFSFTGRHGNFTARKERRGPTGSNWKAYRKRDGKLYSANLGSTADLSLERMAMVARDLPKAKALTRQQPIHTAAANTHQQLSTQGKPESDSPPSVDLLLATKFFVPAPASTPVSRPRLVARLHEGLNSKLTIVVAPAGWGKTTLLSVWCSELATVNVSPPPQASNGRLVPRQVAWVSLDAADNDPVRFWTYVITALNTLYPSVGDTPLILLRSPRTPSIETVLTMLVNALADMSSSAVLVLDDYHVIDSQAIHGALAFLLEHLPSHLHLVITSRADPTLPLSRLRARGALTELRANDLRFTAEEASLFLDDILGFHLPVEALAALDERTEGWIAGLQLAALAMRDRSDITGFIAGFTGSSRFIIDYLAEEVLERQPQDVRDFLLRTSVLDRMCAPLCDAVQEAGSESATPVIDSQEMLERLERSNLFIIALDDDRVWYRYHHLFGDVLRARLRQSQRDIVPVLYRRAAEWCEERELVTEALRYALAGHDHDHIARIITTRAQSRIFKEGDFANVRSWFTMLPETVISSHPGLCYDYAASIVITGDMASVEAYLERAESLLPAFPDLEANLQAYITALRGYTAAVQYHDWPRALGLLESSLEKLPADDAHRGLTLVSLGVLYLSMGPSSEGSRLFNEAADFNRRNGHTMLTLLSLSGVVACQVLEGKLRDAAATCREGLLLAERQGAQLAVTVADLHTRLGMFYYEWNDLETSLYHARAAQEIARIGDYRIHLVTANDAIAEILQAQGDRDGAQAAMTETEQFVMQHTNQPQIKHLLASIRVRRRLISKTGALSDDLSSADGPTWARGLGLSADDVPRYVHAVDYLSLARVLLGQADQRERGFRLLTRLYKAAEESGRLWLQISILTLQAVSLATEGNQPEAIRALQRALTLAEAEGYIRMFVDEGAPMQLLLRDALRAGTAPSYVEKLLSNFGPDAHVAQVQPVKPTEQNLVEPLTPRELEVLQLIVGGASNRDIAEALFVTIGTVKRHTNSLYGKLDAASRTQAVARARELRLF